MGRARYPIRSDPRRLLFFILAVACTLLACGRPSPARQVRITLIGARQPTASAITGAGQAAAIATAAPSSTAPPISVGGSYRLAVPSTLVADLTAALQTLVGESSKLKLVLQSVPDAETVAKSGADLAVMVRQAGGAAPNRAVTIRRQPIAIVLPLTLSPDDLTLAQAIDLLTGAVTDWSQVGGTRRPVRLAFADPTQLTQVGALTGRREAHPSPAARVDSLQALLAAVDAGQDEAAVVPWTGPRLKSKALRIDGRFPDAVEYPLATELLLVPLHKEAQLVADQLGPALAQRLLPSRAGSVLVDAMGDLMLARGVAAMVQRRGAEWPFASVRDRLRTADLRFGNLEFALTDRGTQAHKDYTFRAPPSAAGSLSWAGINVVNLANNHILDYGGQGLLDTLSALASGGILHTGAGADAESAHSPAISEVNGLRIAWLAYVSVPNDSITGFVARSLEAGPGRPGVAWGTPEVIARDVAAARQRADLVIVALHAGFEYIAEPNSVQKELAHAAIDAGAALVLGAHPHVLQGIEYYHGGVIAYSLGNFVFDLDESDIAHYGLPSVLTVILRVSLDAHGVTGLELYPAIINRNDFRPEPVVGEAARPVYERIYKLTDALNGGSR